jgi:acetyl-CoA carboxylase biotin carboxylase subunit
MFKKILVAARGEIALRIIRACRELGIRSVAVHSTADRDSLHVKIADEDVSIGPSPSRESYLNIPRIIAAAEITNADAVHPAYGFLSENPNFADICLSCGISWIGPDPALMKKMGDKAEARRVMEEAGLPVIPGSEGVISSEDEALELCRKIGYPVMVKATAGGGGRGIRIVRDEEQMGACFRAAGKEAEISFGDSGLYVEKYLQDPRHIEVQILGDGKGGVIHFGERECSIQRRHQKLIEESPSPGISGKVREKLFDYAVNGGRHINYSSLGTVEFLVDSQQRIYFLEMNTRVQVEHPVTEMVAGVDLIKEQIRLASSGEFGQSALKARMTGWAIECRINAEDPDRGFLPVPGKIDFFHVPGGPGVRVDSHLYSGCEVPSYYDSLLAKLIVWGKNRDEAIERMKRSLEEFIIEGVPTTIPFLQKIIRGRNFERGDFHTAFLEKEIV